MKGGKRPGAGRPVGAINKRKVEVADRIAALGCDPFEGMALIAMDKNNTMELRGRMYAELAQYLSPKLRSIDQTSEITHNYVARTPATLSPDAWLQQRALPQKTLQ